MFRLAGLLLNLTITILFLAYLVRFPNHFIDVTWPAHAKTHLVSQIAVGSGLCLVMLLLIRYFYQSSPLWLWWSLLGFGAFTFGSYWVAKLIFEIDAPWRNGNSLFLFLTLTYFTGLALCSQRFFSMNDRVGND